MNYYEESEAERREERRREFERELARSRPWRIAVIVIGCLVIAWARSLSR